MTNHIYAVNSQEDKQAIRATQNRDACKEFVERRNKQYDVWGFKRPNMWRHPEMLKICLSDALLFAIIKDPVSVARRRYGVRLNTVGKVAEEIQQFTDTMDKSGLSVYLLSYHQAIIKPDVFVREITKEAGLEVNDEQIEKAAAWIQPNVDGLRNGPYPAIREWIK